LNRFFFVTQTPSKENYEQQKSGAIEEAPFSILATILKIAWVMKQCATTQSP